MSNNKPEMIKHLNVILRNELTAINQYFLHSRTLNHMGYAKLGAKEYEESIDEMKHADELIARILFLGGLPNLQDLGKLHVGETPKEMLQGDHAIEVKAIADLRDAIDFAHESRDFASEEMLIGILVSEEGHQDWLRIQLDLIENIGEKNYLQSQIEA